MTDLVIVPANVIAGANATRASGTAGVAIAAGQLIYKDEATSKYLLCDNNAVDVKARKPHGSQVEMRRPISINQNSGDITSSGVDRRRIIFRQGGTGDISARRRRRRITVDRIGKTTRGPIDIQAPGAPRVTIIHAVKSAPMPRGYFY